MTDIAFSNSCLICSTMSDHCHNEPNVPLSEIHDGAKSEQATEGTLAFFNKLRRLRHDTDDDHINPDNQERSRISAISADDNPSVPFILSQEEQDCLVNEMTTLTSQHTSPIVSSAHPFFLLACVRARKGETNRAMALLCNYIDWRQRVQYYHHLSACADVSINSAVRDVIQSGLFIVAGNTSRDGRPVVTARYQFLNPRRFHAEHTARALAIILEYTIRRYPSAQTHGIVVVDDAAGCTMANLDIGLLRFLARALSKVLPVRVAGVYITNPGWLVNTIFRIIAPFMSDKLKTRVMLCPRSDERFFKQYFETSQIPTFLNLGGSLEWTDVEHSQFVQDVIGDCAQWPPASSHPDGQ